MTDKIERPSAGGCYVRDKAGKLTLVEPPTQPAPGKSALKAAKAKAEQAATKAVSAPKPTQQNEG